MKNNSPFRALGNPDAQPNKEIDTFPAPAGVSLVRFETNEFTSFCPVTGQPDFSSVLIEYQPAEFCIESKSLKLYLQTFRNIGAFAEQLAAEIADQIFDAVHPVFVRVEFKQNVRGGLALSVVAGRRAE